MKNSICICLISLVTLIHTSCKKESNNVSNTGSNNSGGNNSGTIVPSTATSWYAIFESGTTSAIVNGTLQAPNYYVTNAYFSSTPVFYPDPSSGVQVDTAIANGRVLWYYSSDALYEDTTGIFTGTQTPISFPITWHVAGKNGIPNFTYTDNTPLPTYTGYAGIPDTINHAVNFTLTLSGASGYDYVSMSLQDASQHGASAIGGNNVTSLVIPASDMTQFVASNSCTFSINFQKRTIMKVNGKDMLFTSIKAITKTVAIK